MTTEKNIGIAFCWYEAGEWEKMKVTSEDSDTLDSSYEEWKSSANIAIAELMAEGLKINKIAMKMDEFNSWCKENRFKNNSKARSNYAAHKLQERNRETITKQSY